MSKHRLASAVGVALLLASTLTLVSAGGAIASDAAGAATATPACTFNGISFPIIPAVTSGKVIDVKCTGLPALHPYLLAEASLLAGIDPQAKAALSGGVTSVSGLLGALAALQEINMGDLAFPVSDLNGDLNYNWTVPSSQPLAPDAACPPSIEEFNSGLIGCALAMIDLTSFKPVGAGSALMQWKGQPSFLPPAPTLALSASSGTPGQTVNVGDAPGHTTYWWVSTLTALEGLLGGSAAPPAVTVTLGRKTLVSTATVTPASYSNGVYTPPVLSGTFTVPGLKKSTKITVSQSAKLDGVSVSADATAYFKIT